MYLNWKNQKNGHSSPPRDESSSKKIKPCPVIQLRNMEDEYKLFVDRLYNKSDQGIDCREKHCNASIMARKHLTDFGEERPKEEVFSQARDFIEEYYDSLKLKDSAAHLERLDEVRNSVERTGSYDLTFEELQFGARTAWRNSSRCIGRRFYQRLELFDCRRCKTAEDMFEALCKHLESATNGGNIRAIITVFPQRTDATKDFRVWNTQLISYAGHTMPDGSILGDPINADFTIMCEKLGFKFDKTAYDVLPLVLQANGEDPQVFRVPPHLVHEVDIRHAEHAIFEELKLKWYAVPAVSSMMFECGGLRFPAAPFNGWYMTTEISVRDFCDTNRLNLLKKLAAGMGFDTSLAPVMWKDRAVTEVNIAVLESFKKAATTIIDQYTVSESFMEHFEDEYKVRGGCPADWVWLVPPMSGSLCPVFHQEMVSYKLKPCLDYQAPAWKTHVWKKPNPFLSQGGKKWNSLKVLGRVGQISTNIWNNIVKTRQTCTIIYATETGKAAKLAQLLAKVFDKLFNVRTLGASEYGPVENLAKEDLVLFVASTFGNGDPPSNAEEFHENLKMLRTSLHHKSKEETEDTKSFQSVRFGVFGLGSSNYPHFCAFGHILDDLMAELGAQRFVPCGEGDEMKGQEESFAKWCHATFKVCADEFYPDVTVEHAAISELIEVEKEWKAENYRIVPVEQSVKPKVLDLLQKISKADLHRANLKSRKQLQAPHSDRKTILVSLDRHESMLGLDHLPGDHLGVFAPNPTSHVSAVLDWLPREEKEAADVVVEFQTRQKDDWEINDRVPSCSIRQLLTHILDLSKAPQQSLLKNLARLASDPEEKKTLHALADDSDKFDSWIAMHAPDVAFVAKTFPSASPPMTLLLDALDLMTPRFYSISSSTKAFPAEVQLTVAVLEFKSNDGVSHKGLCSTFLNEVDEGTVVQCFVRKAPAFHLPKDPLLPVVMIGPGTGIAPFRSFWQDRHFDLKTGDLIETGRTSLYFGCRSKELDHIYQDELLEMCEGGAINAFHLALSREPGAPKTYVQHVMWENRTDLFRDIVSDKGHFYVCGDVRMADDVINTLVRIFEEIGQLSKEDAKKTLTSMKKENRFHTDIFGATSATGKRRN